MALGTETAKPTTDLAADDINLSDAELWQLTRGGHDPRGERPRDHRPGGEERRGEQELQDDEQAPPRALARRGARRFASRDPGAFSP